MVYSPTIIHLLPEPIMHLSYSKNIWTYDCFTIVWLDTVTFTQPSSRIVGNLKICASDHMALDCRVKLDTTMTS